MRAARKYKKRNYAGFGKRKPRGRAGAQANRLSAHNFLQAFIAMERPNSIHLFYSKGVLDFLVGVVVGIVIGMIIAMYI